MENIHSIKTDLIAWIQHVNQMQILQRMLAIKQEQQTASDDTKRESLFFSLAGAWETPENGDELASLLYEARQDTPREVML